jgi:D-threonate/D-erythronate kinase
MQRPILVIADDLTGAAELAGIAHQFSLRVGLDLRPQHPDDHDVDVRVVNTDTRLLHADAAARDVDSALSIVHAERFARVYKKTDSVLRGNVAVECESMRQRLRLRRVLLLPQNPSRGRVIVDGRYLIDDVPLKETEFAADPLHPARTCDVATLLGTPATHIVICNARDVADVTTHAHGMADVDLAAGGADFFAALLPIWTGRVRQQDSTPTPQHVSTLFLSGTRSAGAMRWAREFASSGGAVTRWRRDEGDLRHCLRDRLLVCVDENEPTCTDVGDGLQSALCRLAVAARDAQAVELLCIDGGATAMAVAESLGYRSLRVTRQRAAGVVQLADDALGAMQIVIKPGSYRWPDALWKRC